MKKSTLALLLATFYFLGYSQTISTIAGTGIIGYSGDGGQATSATLNYIYFVLTDANGNTYVSDYSANVVRKIASNGIITTFAGNGNGGFGGDGGPATSATFNRPIGLCIDKGGNIYIADNKNQCVRKVDVSGKITTIAGTPGSAGFDGDGGPATSAHLSDPNGLAIDTAGNIYVGDYYNNRIRKISKSGIITTVAGNGSSSYNGDNIPATSAAIYLPITLATDVTGNLFICDGNHRLRKVDKATGIITTVAGNGSYTASGDGGPATAAGVDPISVFVEASGNIIISDFYNSRIREVSTDGKISTIAGTGTAGYNGDNIAANTAKLSNQIGITEDATGSIYIADRGNARVRKVTFAIPTITSFTPVSTGNGQTVTITGTNFTGATTVSFGGIAAKSFVVNSATSISAKVNTGATGAVSVTTPGGTATKSGFTYCLTPSVKIAANKTSPICAGTAVTFTATPTNGGTTPAYQWFKNNVVVGTNSSTYTDSTLISTDSVKCVLTSNLATCLAKNNVSSNTLRFTVNPVVTPAIMITSNPADAHICKGQTITFTSSIANGGSAPSYQWYKNGVAAGTDSVGFVDKLPNANDTIYAVLKSNAACATLLALKSNVVKELVDTPNPVIKITDDKGITICTADGVTFTATVTPSYLWKKNGVVVGNNSNQYTDNTLKTSDVVQAFLVSSASACNYSTANILNSNTLKFKVNTPPATPSAINGVSSVKAGQTGVYYSVSALTGVTYAWVLPTGALIDSGQGGNKIKVTWGSTSGNVSVTAINSCGGSATQTKAVTVKTSFAKSESEESLGKSTTAVSDDMHLSPNPASTHSILSFTAKAQEKYTVTIADAQDNVVSVKTITSVKGVNQLRLSTTGLAKGVYFITLSNGVKKTKSKQLVVGQ